MANYYQAARALMGEDRNAGEGAAGLSKSRAKKSAVKKAKPKEVTRAPGGAGRLGDRDEKLGLAKLQKAFAGK